MEINGKLYRSIYNENSIIILDENNKKVAKIDLSIVNCEHCDNIYEKGKYEQHLYNCEIYQEMISYLRSI